jgi:xanthine dehydrogenase iron-sulfur cluster and FAD-binding subunit A
MGQEGNREMLLEDFITGYRKTAIRPDELITVVIIPKISEGEILRTYKISKRRDLDISSVSACFRLKLDGEGLVENIMLVFGGMAEMTRRAKVTEEFLLRKLWSRDIVEEAGELIYSEFAPISDARADADSRRIMAKNLLLKFWSETFNPIKS